MDPLIIFGIGIAIDVCCMILCPIIAYDKGRSVIGWAFGGLLLGLLGLLIVCLLNEVRPTQNK